MLTFLHDAQVAVQVYPSGNQPTEHARILVLQARLAPNDGKAEEMLLEAVRVLEACGMENGGTELAKTHARLALLLARRTLTQARLLPPAC